MDGYGPRDVEIALQLLRDKWEEVVRIVEELEDCFPVEELAAEGITEASAVTVQEYVDRLQSPGAS